MYIAISKHDENRIIMIDQTFPMEHPAHQEYFIFEVDNNLNVDEVMQIARKRRKQLLDKGVQQNILFD